MWKVQVAIFAACLLGTLLPGCSRFEPTPRDFTLVGQRPAKAQEAGNTLAAATAFCKLDTRGKGLASVAAIFSRFRPGKVDEDYIACMKERGYEVVQ
jgi:hypothetical protein